MIVRSSSYPAAPTTSRASTTRVKFGRGFGGTSTRHRVQKDEFAPKMVDIQGGDRNLVPKDAVLGAGSVSTFVSALQGQLYALRKLKTSGDNTMYPVPFMGLQGWVLRDFASGASRSPRALKSPP